jgi:glycosyltransferase involved in cell wall biosynthesis
VVADQFSPEGGFGVTILEGMAAGRPVLASRSEPAVSVTYGDHLPPIMWADDPDEVAARLHELSDPEVRSAVGAVGHDWMADQHDPVRLAQWYLDRLSSVLDD